LPSAIGQEGVAGSWRRRRRCRLARRRAGSPAGLGTWAEEIVVDQPRRSPSPPMPTRCSWRCSRSTRSRYALLHGFGDLKPGDWVLQTGGNSAVSATSSSLAGTRLPDLSVVRRPEAASAVTDLGGDAVVVADDNLAEERGKALGGDQARCCSTRSAAGDQRTGHGPPHRWHGRALRRDERAAGHPQPTGPDLPATVAARLLARPLAPRDAPPPTRLGHSRTWPSWWSRGAISAPVEAT